MISVLFALVISFSSLYAQSNTLINELAANGEPVIYKKDTLFFIYSSLGPFTADFRAEQASQKLALLMEDKNSVTDSIKIISDGEYRHIEYNSKPLFSISAEDSRIAGVSTDELAHRAVASINNKHFDIHYSFSWRDLLI